MDSQIFQNLNMRKDKTDETERGLLVFYHVQGMKPKDIAVKLKRSEKTVYRWIKRLNDPDQQYSRRKIPGGPRCLKSEQVTKLRDAVMENRSKSLEELKNDPQLNLTCSKATICWNLRNIGLPCVNSKRKDLLTKSHTEIRLLKAQTWVIIFFKLILT